MVEYITLCMAIIIILVIHVCIELSNTVNKNVLLNRAIIVDCVICLVYLIVFWTMG